MSKELCMCLSEQRFTAPEEHFQGTHIVGANNVVIFLRILRRIRIVKVVETASYLYRHKKSKTFCRKKNQIFFWGLPAKNFGTLSDIFWQGCWNCFLRIQRNILENFMRENAFPEVEEKYLTSSAKLQATRSEELVPGPCFFRQKLL